MTIAFEFFVLGVLVALSWQIREQVAAQRVQMDRLRQVMLKLTEALAKE